MTETLQNLPVVPHHAAPVPPPPSPVVNLLSFDTLDRVGRSTIARFTAGISPHAEAAAWLDWISHFRVRPGGSSNLQHWARCWPQGLPL